MASVTASPGTLASDNSAGAVAWSNASNAASSNNIYATCVLGDSQISHYLKATNFDFSAIPDGSTINGVKATMERKVSPGSNLGALSMAAHRG